MRNIVRFEAFSDAGLSCAFFTASGLQRMHRDQHMDIHNDRTDKILKDIF